MCNERYEPSSTPVAINCNTDYWHSSQAYSGTWPGHLPRCRPDDVDACKANGFMVFCIFTPTVSASIAVVLTGLQQWSAGQIPAYLLRWLHLVLNAAAWLIFYLKPTNRISNTLIIGCESKNVFNTRSLCWLIMSFLEALHNAWNHSFVSLSFSLFCSHQLVCGTSC